MHSLTIQEEAFDPSTELRHFLTETKTSGAVCQFLGLVRDYSTDCHGEPTALKAMRLECYRQMSEKVLYRLLREAERRFNLEHVRLIHRYGMMQPNAIIVMVITASPHRADAFASCEFLMDRMKTEAPFLKFEYAADGAENWVEATKTDDDRADRWK